MLEGLHDNRPLSVIEKLNKKIPFDRRIFWVGVTLSSTVFFSALWLIVSGAQIAFNSNWIVKPATVNQLDDVQRVVKELERRQQKTDERLEKIGSALEALAQNSAVTAEAVRQANDTANRTSAKVDDLLLSAFARATPLPTPSYKPPAKLKRQVVQPLRTGAR